MKKIFIVISLIISGCAFFTLSGQARTLEDCDKEANDLLRRGCLDQVLYEQGTTNFDFKLCNQIGGGQFATHCYDFVIENKADLSMDDCQQIDKLYDIPLSKCKSTVIDKNASPELCQKLTEQSDINRCYSHYAANGHPQYCYKLKRGDPRSYCLSQNATIVFPIGSIIYALIALIMIVLYIWLKGLFGKNKIPKNIGTKIFRGIVYATPGWLIFLFINFLGFFGSLYARGEEGMGLGIIVFFFLGPIAIITTIILFIKGLLWEK